MRRFSSFDSLIACLRGTPPSGVDWNEVAREANTRLVSPALYAAVADDGRVPEDLLAYLRLLYDLNQQRNTRLKRQALEATAALNRADIEPLLLKGVGWLFTVPDERRGERIISDLDLMIDSDRLHSGMSQLFSLGYRARAEFAGEHASASLFRQQDPGEIDLHHRPPGTFYLMGRESARVSSESVEVEGARARVPGPTDRALHLIVHDMMHDGRLHKGTVDLRHLLDLRELAKEYPGVDWAGIRRSLQPSARASWGYGVCVINLRELLHVDVRGAGKIGVVPRLFYRRQMLKIRHPWFRVLDDLVTLLLLSSWRALRSVHRWALRTPPAKKA